jgi:hypothetical protein
MLTGFAVQLGQTAHCPRPRIGTMTPNHHLL